MGVGALGREWESQQEGHFLEQTLAYFSANTCQTHALRSCLVGDSPELHLLGRVTRFHSVRRVAVRYFSERPAVHGGDAGHASTLHSQRYSSPQQVAVFIPSFLR